MLTYQVRPRVFKVEGGAPVTFPADCTVVLHLQPSQAFGASASGGRTAVRSTAACVHFNANTGEHAVESEEPLAPLAVSINDALCRVRLTGATLTVCRQFDSPDDLASFIEGLYFALPALLNVPFADPPYVERVDGTIGGIAFGWELENWHVEWRNTTQTQQQSAFAQAWRRIQLLAEPRRRRLAAALHYFHVAARLARRGCIPGEFVAEVVLNLCKVLEVLFPNDTEGQNTMEAAREGLRSIGFTPEEIEADFIPAIALRNAIDVGHIELGLFGTEQLKIVHSFTDAAETTFRQMFERLLNRIERGEFELAPYSPAPPGRDKIKVIERLKLNLRRKREKAKS